MLTPVVEAMPLAPASTVPDDDRLCDGVERLDSKAERIAATGDPCTLTSDGTSDGGSELDSVIETASPGGAFEVTSFATATGTDPATAAGAGTTAACCRFAGGTHPFVTADSEGTGKRGGCGGFGTANAPDAKKLGVDVARCGLEVVEEPIPEATRGTREASFGAGGVDSAPELSFPADTADCTGRHRKAPATAPGGRNGAAGFA